MTPEAYKRCIQIVEEGFSWKLPAGAHKIWWDVLKDEKINDEDFEDGCIRAMTTLKRSPSLAELIECCKQARITNNEARWQAQKLEENKYRRIGTEDILNNGVMAFRSSKVRGLIQNALDLLNGKIDKGAWQEKQKKALAE